MSLSVACATPPPPAPAPEPPPAPPPVAAPAPPAPVSRAVTETLHGVEVRDPYRWLEAEKDPEVQTWMRTKNVAARQHLAGLPGRDVLTERLKSLIYVEVRSAPEKRKDRLFFSRRPADREKTIYYWQQGEKGEPKVLIDANTLSTDGSISVSEVVPSEDGKLVAYQLKGNNADESTLKIMEVDTGKVLEADTIAGLRYTRPAWTPDGKGFFYTWIPNDPKIPSNERMGLGEIRYHRLGTDPATDSVFREKTGDPERWMGAEVSSDGKYLFLTINRGWSELDLYVRFLSDPKGDWKPLFVGQKALASVVAFKDKFYLTTNQGAPRYQIYSIDPKRLDRAQWKLLVPEDAESVIDGVVLVGGHLGLQRMRKASSELEIRDLKGKLVRKIALPTLGSASPLIGRADDDTAYFGFVSFTYPYAVFKTSIKTGKTELHSKVEAPVNPSDFEVEQVQYPSKDGTSISMFLFKKKGTAKNGKNPTLLYGYGGFNISMTPNFNPIAYAWVEQGGIYALANLRGGGEYGEAWHQAGMLGLKQNVFDDFIAAAEYLVREQWTATRHLAIEGRSNGGLLVGAAMTQRPDLYRAVICGVPLLDMVRYHLFGIGRAWIPEYGTAEDPEQFKWLHAYSPYHQLKAGVAYPSLLMLATDSDDRVDPLHARKFSALLEEVSEGKILSLLRIEEKAGHGGADVRNKTVEQGVDTLAFLRSQLAE